MSHSHTANPHTVSRARRRALALVVLLLVGGACAAAQSSRAEQVERALTEVQAQRYDAALAIFRDLARQNPRDYEARNWVARLESWKGNYATAEDLYRGVLRDTPDDLEAELGLVDVLGWQKRYGEAQERLQVLRERHPRNTEVLLRQGRIARWQHQQRQALDYYQEVLALDPTNAEARAAVDTLRAQKPFRLEGGYYLEEFDFAGNTQGQFVEFLYRDYHRLTLLARFQYQNKFRQNNTRYTVGATYRFWERTWVRGEFSWAPSGDTVVANQDYTLEVTQGLRPGLAAGGGYRFLKFRSANVQALTALLNWDLRSTLHLYVRYIPARTRSDLSARSVWNHGGWTRLVWDTHRSFSPYVLFAVGAEDFTGISAEQLGRFAAQTYGVGAEVRLMPGQGLQLGYYFQNRSQEQHEQGFRLSYFLGF
ncbi:MAG: tetratricopeptide repeat protein [Terriglobia bacterium]